MTENHDTPADRKGVAVGPASPEVWSLEHPRHGTLEVAVGDAASLRTVDPGFPEEKKKDDDDNDADSATADSDPATALTSSPGFVLLRDGGLVARARKVGNHKVSITADPPKPDKFTSNPAAVSGPRVLMRSNVLDTKVRQVMFREGWEVVHFDPPPGSEAEARLADIAASPWKRVLYPVAAGVGKSGWAIAMILLIPILGRLINPVIDWITERMPDVDIPWPDISLPSIPWPDITLPSINLPEVDLPGWVEFLLEYSKVWIPLLIGVALAMVAVRHSRKSRRIKQEWEAQRAAVEAGEDEAESDDEH